MSPHSRLAVVNEVAPWGVYDELRLASDRVSIAAALISGSADQVAV